MSSYIEKEVSDIHLPDPGWVAVLLAYDDDPQSTQVRFDDVSLEWGRGSHNPRFSRVTRIIGNKIMPLGFMIAYHLHDLAEDFMRTFDVDIHATCLWIDCHPYTPAEYVSVYSNIWFWAPFLWRAGVKATELGSCVRNTTRTARDGLVLRYRKRERALTALAWTCDQIAGTAWSDCAEPVVKRMRQGEE